MKTKLLGILLPLIITSSIIGYPKEAGVLAAGSGFNRIGGDDRYETAIRISNYGWEQSDTAVIAAGEDFADALCAAPLAKKYQAPILLSQKDELREGVVLELKRLGVGKVFIIGGTGAISDDVEDELKSLGIKCVRIYGADRYETSVEVAKYLGDSSEIAVAAGDNFPDALSIAPIAAKKGIPIILSQGSSLPQAVKQYLKYRNVSKTHVVGGEGAISKYVFNELSPYNPERLWGNDRYETNIAVLSKFLSDLDFEQIYIAAGRDFPDALSGSVLASRTSSPVILADETYNKITSDFVGSKLSSISRINVFGGDGAISKAVAAGLIYGYGRTFGYYTLLKKSAYEYSYVMTIANNGSSKVTDISLQVDLGRLNSSPYQSGETVEFTGPGASVAEDAEGNKKAIISIESLEGGEYLEYKLVRRFKNSGIKYNVDLANASGDYSGFEAYSKYTCDEDKIESDSPEIKLKAEEIVKDEDRPYEKAKKIFEFVNTSLDYDFSEGNKGALNALQTKKGVCEDFADLFVAMTRAVGVPSRVVTGYWVESADVNVPEDVSTFKHAWAEFYLPEYGWIVVEPTVMKTGISNDRIPAYDYFAGLDEPGHFVHGYGNESSYSMKYYTEGDSKSEVTVTKNEYIKKL